VVGDYDALDSLRDPMGQDEPGDRTDSVNHQRRALQPALPGEARQKVRVPGQRVVELLGLGRASEPRQVRRDTTVRSTNGSQIQDLTGFPCK
jgi:hypothetical protein